MMAAQSCIEDDVGFNLETFRSIGYGHHLATEFRWIGWIYCVDWRIWSDTYVCQNTPVQALINEIKWLLNLNFIIYKIISTLGNSANSSFTFRPHNKNLNSMTTRKQNWSSLGRISSSFVPVYRSRGCWGVLSFGLVLVFGGDGVLKKKGQTSLKFEFKE